MPFRGWVPSLPWIADLVHRPEDIVDILSLPMQEEKAMANGDPIIAGATTEATESTGIISRKDPAHPELVGGALSLFTDSGDALYALIEGELAFGVVTTCRTQPNRLVEAAALLAVNESPTGIGIHAESANYGITAEGADVALLAANNNGRCRAFLGTGDLAGDFYGDVYIHGKVTAEGHKSAVVPHPDGSQRQLYCLESPDMWFEDFGKADLIEGEANVTLDADFVSIVDSTDYYIFLTEYGDSEGLYISGQTPTGFQVRERRDGQSTLPFRYRVVARRADLSASRLEKVIAPTPPDLPPLNGPDRAREVTR